MALSAHRLQKIIATTLEVQRIALVRENSVDLVLVQSEYAMRPLPDCKYRMAHHWRDQSLEAAPIRGQLCFENGVVVIDDRIANRGDRAERTQGLCGRHFANNPKILVSPLDPQLPIGIQQDVFGAMILKAGSDQRPQFPDQFFISAFGDLLKFVHPAPTNSRNQSKSESILLFDTPMLLYIQH